MVTVGKDPVGKGTIELVNREFRNTREDEENERTLEERVVSQRVQY
jgi:hypothetical protein